MGNLRFLYLPALTVALACGGDTTLTLVPRFATDGQPLEPVTITILPYDPEALRDSLAAAYGAPRPRYPELMALFEAWQPPEVSDTGTAATTWRATRDSVTALADSLRAVDRRSPGYAAAYARFRSLYQRFTQRSAARNALHRDATADVRDLAQRAGQAADSLRRWEERAWADFDTVAGLAAAGRDSVVVVALADTPLTVTLPPGRWWVLARAPVEGNPFLVRTWRLPLRTSGFPLRLPLDTGNATRAWRH